MRLAILHWAFWPIVGGVESHLALFCRQMLKRGHEVYLLTADHPGSPAEEIREGLKIKRSPFMNLNTLTPHIIELKAAEVKKVMEDFLVEVKPDIVHAHNFHYFSYVHAASLQEICQKHSWPLIHTAHNVWEDETSRKIDTLAKGWDHNIAVSHYIRQELMVRGYIPEKITTVHHGIDLQRFAPPSEEEKEAIYKEFALWRNRRLIFSPARMSFAKGSDVIVRALDIVRRQEDDVLLVMTGTINTVDWDKTHSSEVALIQKTIEELNLKEHVFIQFLPWEVMPSVYKVSEICLYPSVFQEPFGLAILEAIATAKPIIVTRAGGMPEIITPGYNGFMVSIGDYEELARYIIYLLSHPEVGKSVGENGRKVAEENFSDERMTEDILKVYEQFRG